MSGANLQRPNQGLTQTTILNWLGHTLEPAITSNTLGKRHRYNKKKGNNPIFVT